MYKTLHYFPFSVLNFAACFKTRKQNGFSKAFNRKYGFDCLIKAFYPGVLIVPLARKAENTPVEPEQGNACEGKVHLSFIPALLR